MKLYCFDIVFTSVMFSVCTCFLLLSCFIHIVLVAFIVLFHLYILLIYYSCYCVMLSVFCFLKISVSSAPPLLTCVSTFSLASCSISDLIQRQILRGKRLHPCWCFHLSFLLVVFSFRRLQIIIKKNKKQK